MFKKIATWYKRQTTTTQGLIWVGILLIIGIIIRWQYVIEGVVKGFNFLNTK